MRGILLGLALALLALPAAAQSQGSEGAKLTGGDNSSDPCVNATDPDVGIRTCTENIQSGQETTANLSGDYSNRAAYYHSKGLYKEAIADLNKAISLNPNSAITYIILGNIYNDNDQYDLAITNENRAIALHPGQNVLLAAYLGRGNAYSLKNFFDLAIADYNKAIALNPNIADVYNSRAYAYKAKGFYDQAIADATKAITLRPNYDLAYFNRGNAYEHKGFKDQAIADYRAALKLDPNYKDAQTGLQRLGAQ